MIVEIWELIIAELGSLSGSSISAINLLSRKRGIRMANINLCGVAQLLRALIAQNKMTKNEARKILARVAAQTGADIIISF